MTVRIRPHLLELPSYRAGRRPNQVAAENAVKLSSNESPFPLLPGVAESIAAATPEVNRYPDSSQGPLRDLLADNLGVDAGRVVVAGGSMTIFGPLLQCVVAEGDEVVFAWRTFEAPITATAVLAGRPVFVPLRDSRHDLSAMADAMTERTRAVVVCNPNNPTGTVVHTEELLQFLKRVPPETLVVLDEAYHDFATDPEVPDGMELLRSGHENLAVLRTFSKAQGLAGLRIGYCVTSERLATVLTRLVPVFSVSRLAEAAAIASIGREASDAAGSGGAGTYPHEAPRSGDRYAEERGQLRLASGRRVLGPAHREARGGRRHCSRLSTRRHAGDCRATGGERRVSRRRDTPLAAERLEVGGTG